MKVKVWTILHKSGADDVVKLATGDYSSGERGERNYCYASEAELRDVINLQGIEEIVSDSFEEAQKNENSFWIECVEVEL